LIEEKIKQIIIKKEKSGKIININQKDKKKNRPKKTKKKKKKKKKKSIAKANPVRKSIKRKFEIIDSNNTVKDCMNSKSVSKLGLKKLYSIKNNIDNVEENKAVHNEKNNSFSRPDIFKTFSDYEFNFLSYEDALKFDKRSFLKIYMSLIKLKHPIIFSFIPVKDYNTMIIKIDIFMLSFAIKYAINALFFNESTIHQIYEDKGEYNLAFFLPKIILSFCITNVFIIIIKYFFLSERDITKIKNSEAKSLASEEVTKVEKCLIIKYIIFYVLGILFLALFWYYLSSFCAVYQNSQIFLIINTFICFAFSLLYPFFINFLPVALRRFSLSNNNKNSQLIYRISLLIQLM
jgi:hypothetical protein